MNALKLSLLAALAVALAGGARAQTLVVRSTSDGLAVRAPDEAPVDDVPSALLTRTDAGGWHLRTLSPGDVPSEVAARVLPDLPDVSRLQEQAARLQTQTARLRDQVGRPRAPARRVGTGSQPGGDAPSGDVSYHIRGPLADGSPDVLVRLSESDALESFSVSGPDGGPRRVEAWFGFGSVAEWARWKDQSATTALLERLIGPDRQGDLSVRK